MARASCLKCAMKHISTAEALMNEAMLGYELHCFLAVGHLVQAEEELLSEFHFEAEIVRAERVKYIDGLILTTQNGEIKLNASYGFPTIEILNRLMRLAIKNKLFDKVEEELAKKKRRK